MQFPSRQGSPEDFERERRGTSLAPQEQSSAGKESRELSPDRAHGRAVHPAVQMLEYAGFQVKGIYSGAYPSISNATER